MSMSKDTTTNPKEGGTHRVGHDESLRGWTAILLSVVVVGLTAVLFGAGHGYRQGYLYEFGFDLAQLPADFHDTLFWGFSGGTPQAIAWLVAAVVALPATGLLIWLVDVLWQRALNRSRLLRRLAASTGRPPDRVGTHVKLILGGLLVLSVLYFLVVGYLAMAEFQEAGTKRGKQLVAALRTDAKTASAKYEMQWIEIWLASGTVIRGYRLLCTDRLCSIYDPDPKVQKIRLVSLENLQEMRVLERPRT